MPTLSRWLSAFLVCLVVAGAAAVEAAEQEGIARVSTVWGNNQPMPRLVAPGEWLPHSCYLAVPYRGGSALRFERREEYQAVSIDGGPEQPAWIIVSAADDLAVLKRELDRGSRGFAVLCRSSRLASLPPLPAGRDIALAVTGTLPDFASLAKQHGVAALALYLNELTDLGPLAEFTDVTSLRLTCHGSASDLRPLAHLAKLTWLRLSGFRETKDLKPLAEAPNLQGLKLWGCKNVSDLGPLAGARRLAVLKVYGCESLCDLTPLAKLEKLGVLHLIGTAVADLGPLAGLTELLELDLSNCKQVTDLRPLADLKHLEHIDLGGCDGVKDLAPLREMIRRGGKVTPPKDLQPQLETLRGKASP